MKSDARNSISVARLARYFSFPVSVSNHSRANRVHMPIIHFKTKSFRFQLSKLITLSLSMLRVLIIIIPRSCVSCRVFHVCRKLYVFCSRVKMGKESRQFAVYYIRFCIYIYIYNLPQVLSRKKKKKKEKRQKNNTTAFLLFPFYFNANM